MDKKDKKEIDDDEKETKSNLTTNTNIVNFTNDWNTDDDIILKEWIDKSSCLKWLHEKSYKKYKSQYFRQMLPVIIISTLTGVANFSINQLPKSYQQYASLITGGFNILGAMISTVSQFLKTSELKESHNIASKSWDKFNRSIKIELQRHPKERSPKKDIFVYSLKEFDRLVEISPDIPNSVIKQFKSEYKNASDLIKPEIADKIVSSKVYDLKDDNLELVNVIDDTDKELLLLKSNYINKFINKYNRQPTKEEIQEFIELQELSESNI